MPLFKRNCIDSSENGTFLEMEVLSDGSKVYNVLLSSDGFACNAKVRICCEDKAQAEKLFTMLSKVDFFIDVHEGVMA